MLYQSAALQGDPFGCLYLAYCYYCGEGIDQNDFFAAKWFTQAATFDNAEAKRMLGECFYTGRGVDQSYTVAVEWYSKAAEQDDSEAQCMLGVCYALGHTLP